MLPATPGGADFALGVDNLDVVAGNRASHKTRTRGRQRGARRNHHVAFGLTIELVDGDAQRLAAPLQELGAERLAAAGDAAHFQLQRRVLHRRRAHKLDRGRRQKRVAHAKILDDRERRLAAEFCQAMGDHGNAVMQRGKQHVDQSADPRPVGGRPNQVAGLRQEVVAHLDAGQVAQEHAMRVQRAFWLARRPRGVDDQRRIIGTSFYRFEIRWPPLHRRPEVLPFRRVGLDQKDMFSAQAGDRENFRVLQNLLRW